MHCNYHMAWRLHFWESCQREEVGGIDLKQPALLSKLKPQLSSGAKTWHLGTWFSDGFGSAGETLDSMASGVSTL